MAGSASSCAQPALAWRSSSSSAARTAGLRSSATFSPSGSAAIRARQVGAASKGWRPLSPSRPPTARPWAWGAQRVDAVLLTVALLCTKSFNYEKLMVGEIQRQRGIPLEKVGKVDVIHGKLLVEDLDGNTLVSEPVRDFHGAALKGCDECADFLGRAADISVGSRHLREAEGEIPKVRRVGQTVVTTATNTTHA